MRVFVTGAAGFIGSAVVADLLKNNHTVLGLARNDANAAAISKAGAEVHRGDLEDLPSLQAGAKACDGVIHLAFIHDFQDFERCVKADAVAVKALGEALAGTGKPLVIASGTLAYQEGTLGHEDGEPDRTTPFGGRNGATDHLNEISKDGGVRGITIRLCPTVHGVGDKGFMQILAKTAQDKGVAAYVGDGSNVWPAVHRLDAAVLFRLALEKGRPGATYNAVGEQGVPMKEIMEYIGKKVGVPAVSKTKEELMQLIGFFGFVVARDGPCSSEKTQKELDWKPTGPGLLEDMEKNYDLVKGTAMASLSGE